MPWSTEDLKRLIEVEAQLQGVDPRLALAVATQESYLNPNAKGDNGRSLGLFQLQEAAAKDAGIDPARRHEVPVNVEGGIRYLKLKLAQSGGNVEQALSRYNRGTPDYRGIGDPHYVQNVLRFYPGRESAQPQPRQGPNLLARVTNLLSPASAEAATPQPTGRSRLEEIEAELTRRDAQSPPSTQAPPSPPTARSTPEEAAAYRAWARQQATGGAHTTAPVSQTTPTTPMPPGASQGPARPSLMERFDALPSVRSWSAADRAARRQEFAALTPDLQEEFLRGEEQPPGSVVATVQPPGSATPPAGVTKPAALVRLTQDMDDDAILTALGYDPELVKQAKLYQPGAFKSRVTDPNSTLASVMNSPLGGLLRGIRDPAEGALQLGTRGLRQLGLYSDADVAYHDALIKLAEADYQQNIRKGEKVDPQTGEQGLFSDPSRIVGGALAVPIPAGVATTIPRTVARNVVTGATMGALQPGLEAGPQPGSAQDPYWSEKGKQTATGAVLGGTLGTVMERTVAPAVNRVINWGRGVLQPAAQELADLSERFGVRLSYGDVRGGAIIPKVETGLEAVPGSGAGRFRTRQQADVRQAGTELAGEFQTTMQTTPWRDLPAVQRAAQQGNREAQALLSEINAAGDDWGRVIQASGKLNLWQDRQRATQLYNRVEQLAQPLGNMPVTRTVQAIDNAVTDVQGAVLPSPELQREVVTLMGRAREAISPTQVNPTPNTSYGRMRRFLSDLGDMRRTATDPQTSRYLNQIETALRQDMEAFTTRSNVPALRTAQREADTFWRTRVVPYREGQLAKAMERDLPDEIYGRFVRQGADRAQYFYRGLDPRGQAAVRYGMVQEAVEQAMSGPHPDVFSPARFVTSMRRSQDASEVFFRGQPQWEINGFTRLMQHATRAGQYMENPPTGWRAGVLGGLIGGGALSPLTMAKVFASSQALRILFMTQGGRNFLLAASDLEPGSPAFQRALDRFMRSAGRAGASGAAQRQGSQEPVGAGAFP